MPAGLATGALVNIGILLPAAALIAKLVEGEGIPESSIGYAIMVTLMGAAFFGAMTASGRIKRQRLLVCSLSGLLFFGILMSMTALFFGGQYEAVGVTCLLVMGGSILPVFVGNRKNRRGKGSIRKLMNR